MHFVCFNMGQYSSFMDDSLTPCELSLDPFVFLSEEEKKRLRLNCVKLLKSPQAKILD